ncbi:AAR_G0001670.mRNA.1.CDS.1 [Saccharomyces cerevisiae]|nr:AAR_G0001670.mRNA.1.CDS.1 [Saccharomyces cerevisiae]CAI6482157.1 AAR_G0001670.mRNA.1.CDS.1 [Saccharomyces cerevisiae]
MCANIPEFDSFYENENINYNLESFAPLNCDVNSPFLPINNNDINVNAYGDANLTYSNFLLSYNDKLATTTAKNNSINNSNSNNNSNNIKNNNNNHNNNNLLGNDISQMAFLLDYPSTLNEPQFAVNCKDIYRKDISTPSSLVSSLPSAKFSLSLSNSPSPPPPSSSSLKHGEAIISNASESSDIFADPNSFEKDTMPLTQELTLENLNNQLNYPDFTINAIEQDPAPSSFSSSSSSSESTVSSSRKRKPCHDSYTHSSPSSSESKKISDSRLSAEGLAKVLNLESPEEALKRERFILGIFQNELNYPLGYKTWIRDTTKEYRTKLINQLHERVKVKYPEYNQSILETIIRRGTYYMMQSRLRRERRMKLKERKRTT